MRETLRAVEGLAVDARYARQYAEFQRLMVYGDAAEYAACTGTLRELSGRLSSIFGGGPGLSDERRARRNPRDATK
jgi:hypothetical protein